MSLQLFLKYGLLSESYHIMREFFGGIGISYKYFYFLFGLKASVEIKIAQ